MKKKRSSWIFSSSQLFLILIILVLLIGSFGYYKSQKNQVESKLYYETEASSQLYSSVIQTEYNRLLGSLEYLANNGTFHIAMTTKKWENDAQLFLDSFQSVSRIVLLSNNLQVSKAIPFDEDLIDKGVDYLPNSTSHFSLLQKLTFQNRLEGFLYAIVDIDKFIDLSLLKEDDNYILSLTTKGADLYQDNEWQQRNVDYTFTRNIALRNNTTLSLSLAPHPDYISGQFKKAQNSLYMSLLFSLVITVAAYYGQKFYSQRQIIQYKIQSENRLKTVINAGNVGTWEWNLETGEKDYNEKWAEILGYKLEEIRQNKDAIFNQLIHPNYVKKIEEIVNKLLNQEINYYEIDFRMKNGNGKWIWVNERARVTKWSANDTALEVSGTLIDITDRKKLEEEKKKELDKLKLVFEKHGAMVLYIEVETGKILDANPSAINFYGYSKSEMMQMHIQDINMFSRDKVKELMQKANSKSQNYFTFSHQLKSGEIRMVDVYSSPVDYQGKEVLLSIIFDVTKREEAMEEIKYLAYHDHLTGVYNRRYLEETFNNLNSEINYPLAFIMADINGLKLVNDTYGHKFGDEVIRKTSKIIKSVIEDNGVLARIGGDEFGILIKNTTKDEIAKLTYDLEEALDLDITIENNVKVYLSVALGYAIMKDQESLDFLLSESEKHVYRRKYLNESSRHSHIIEAMMSTLFLKSEREQLHSARVGKYCKEIAEALNWHKNRVNLVRVAGVLHDIGKIGIDESILNKEDKLNLDEWRLMLQHPVKSAKILEKIKEYKDLSQIVISHHERWDGKGYPIGIKKEKIPIEARIISVADAYDSMIEERPYKEKMTKEEAINELKKCSGSQFDPDIVDVFINKVLTKSK